MKILSIETSCDDTAISIIEATGGTTNASFKILATGSNSQINIHIPYGGVFPMLAKREHLKYLPILLDDVLIKAKLYKKEMPVDVIAVTYGPGLEPALWTGIVFAKELATKWKVPLVPTNHMEGHILSVFGKNKGKFSIPKIKKPMLSLLVSGGHTEMVLTKKWMDYEIIGETLDDAVGEAFDKAARMLGLPYPGGPEISKLAEIQRSSEIENQIFRGRNFSSEKFTQSSIGSPSDVNGRRRLAETPKELFPFSLPRPMLHSKNLDFSFSGLKTAVLYLIKDLGGVQKLSQEQKAQIALEFENAAIECLVHKTKKAIEKYKIKTLIVAGGVSANKHLRNEMEKVVRSCLTTKLYFPTRELSTDNSIMIGIAGYLNFIKNKKKVPNIDSIKATGNLRL